MAEPIFEPLGRADIAATIDRTAPGPPRVPQIRTHWWGEGLPEQYGDALDAFDRYPEDAVFVMTKAFDPAEMDLPWLAGGRRAGAGHDAGSGALPSWDRLDAFLDRLGDPDDPADRRLDALAEPAARARAAGRYVIFGWWTLFFEAPWMLRGMANLMIDYYENPRQVHRLHDRLCTLYEGWIRRAARELAPDGFWCSDDLGNQRQLMMKPAQFREFQMPYYRRIGRTCRELGLHWWLHSCGNNTEVLGDLIEAGVNVFHPVQKHTMDAPAVAAAFGDRLTFLAGFDVQQTLPRGTPDDVRREVRALIDTFDRPDGGLCLAAGNGIVAGTPLANIEAFLDEATRYGTAHRAAVGARRA